MSMYLPNALDSSFVPIVKVEGVIDPVCPEVILTMGFFVLRLCRRTARAA